jgi:hypothetical protein
LHFAFCILHFAFFQSAALSGLKGAILYLCGE